MQNSSAERLVGWVDNLAPGFGVPPRDMRRLLAAVRGTLQHAAGEGRAIDRVALVRREEAIEVRLSSDDGEVDTFMFT